MEQALAGPRRVALGRDCGALVRLCIESENFASTASVILICAASSEMQRIANAVERLYMQ